LWAGMDSSSCAWEGRGSNMEQDADVAKRLGWLQDRAGMCKTEKHLF
jgi:hypothetical protein